MTLQRDTGYTIRAGSAILAERRAKLEAERLEEARKVRASFVRYLDRRLDRRYAA
jgi:hypothetical protein